ncbi:MAG: recombinase family protein [Desulfovibrionaceae bacterium]
MEGAYVSYLRVSTAKQGHDGNGIHAQRKAIEDYLNGGNWELLVEYVEVESGRKQDRPQLDKALAHCKVTGATLLIAKLDRLSRNAAFLLQLQDAGVKFTAVDNPQANQLTVGILAVIAQDEAKRISERTKAGLQAAKARGKKLGSPKGAQHLRGKYQPQAIQAVKDNAQNRAEELRGIVDDIKASGRTSLNAIAKELNVRRIKTPRGGKWYPASVGRLLGRLKQME